jgi:hypothetical protein
MKKILLVMALAFLSTSLMAQIKKAAHENEKKEKAAVPSAVTKAFQKEFSINKVTWDKEGINYEAEFTMNGKETSALYDINGHRKELEVEIKKEELPIAVTAYIKKNYPDKKMSEASKITDDRDIVTYEAEIRKGKESTDLIFDSKGNFIKIGAKD